MVGLLARVPCRSGIAPAAHAGRLRILGTRAPELERSTDAFRAGLAAAVKRNWRNCAQLERRPAKPEPKRALTGQAGKAPPPQAIASRLCVRHPTHESLAGVGKRGGTRRKGPCLQGFCGVPRLA